MEDLTYGFFGEKFLQKLEANNYKAYLKNFHLPPDLFIKDC